MTLDNILSGTLIYEFYMQRALEKAREEIPQILREEDRREGIIEGLRQALLIIFQSRSPKLGKIAQKKLAQIEDPALLRTLLVKIVAAQTMEDAQYLLLELDYPDELEEQHS